MATDVVDNHTEPDVPCSGRFVNSLAREVWPHRGDVGAMLVS